MEYTCDYHQIWPSHALMMTMKPILILHIHSQYFCVVLLAVLSAFSHCYCVFLACIMCLNSSIFVQYFCAFLYNIFQSAAHRLFLFL